MGQVGFATELVEAWDAEDALVVAAERHPDRLRPRVAVLAALAGPLHPEVHQRRP